jgi:hypothetical protein
MRDSEWQHEAGMDDDGTTTIVIEDESDTPGSRAQYDGATADAEKMNTMQIRNQGIMGGMQVGFGGTNLIASGAKHIIRRVSPPSSPSMLPLLTYYSVWCNFSLSNANRIGDVSGYNLHEAGTCRAGITLLKPTVEIGPPCRFLELFFSYFIFNRTSFMCNS